MKMSEMFPSNYLKKEDVATPTRATIRNVIQDEISGDGGKELKAVLNFVGNLKPMILNRGNATTLEEAYGDDSDAWHGKTVEIYVDPSVMFGGKRVGGVRLRIPSTGHNSGGAVIELWDVSDGQQVLPRQTTEQVRLFLSSIKVPMESVKIKLAGAPRESAMTADRWIEGGEPVSSEIPF